MHIPIPIFSLSILSSSSLSSFILFDLTSSIRLIACMCARLCCTIRAPRLPASPARIWCIGKHTHTPPSNFIVVPHVHPHASTNEPNTGAPFPPHAIVFIKCSSSTPTLPLYHHDCHCISWGIGTCRRYLCHCVDLLCACVVYRCMSTFEQWAFAKRFTQAFSIKFSAKVKIQEKILISKSRRCRRYTHKRAESVVFQSNGLFYVLIKSI